MGPRTREWFLQSKKKEELKAAFPAAGIAPNMARHLMRSLRVII